METRNFRPGQIEHLANDIISNKTIRNTRYGYDSQALTYGYTLKTTPDGALIYDDHGLLNMFDRKGDYILRKVDDNHIKEPLNLLRRHPRKFLHHLKTGPKRFRGNAAEVLDNAQRLGLTEFYSHHASGIQILKPEIFTEGINLFDIYRGDALALQEIDRYQALQAAGEYIGQIHALHGAVGEVLVNDIIFQQKEGTQVSNPVLNLPDIVWNTTKYSQESLGKNEPKAIDVLDFLSTVIVEEIRSTGNRETIDTAINAVLSGYRTSDTGVLKAVHSLAKRGRLTLPGDVSYPMPLDIHNKIRIGVSEPSLSTFIRKTIIDMTK